MSDAIPFDAYVATLGRLSGHIDPTASTPEAVTIQTAVKSLADLPVIDLESVAAWAQTHPHDVPVLGLAVGLTQEKLKNNLVDAFETAGWVTLARKRSGELVEWLDTDYDLLRLLRTQRDGVYDFADILVARAGSRASATRAGASGRKIEDEIEAIAAGLGLSYVTRSQFTGRNGRTAPADLIVPTVQSASIVVAAKGFDSTGSKLSDAVREIVEMADVRLPTQFVMAIIDGIGWKSRLFDLRKIHQLWSSKQIDGVYTLANLDQFRDDLKEAARLRGLLPDPS